jgi:hypothetical protein
LNWNPNPDSPQRFPDKKILFCNFALGLYSETGFHNGRNFVCLWRRHSCRSQVIDLSLSALIS